MGEEKNRKELLNRAGREVLRAACATDDEIQKAAASPFLYAKIRAGVEREKQQPQSLPESRLLWLVARQAIPALALIAVIAFSAFWMFGRDATASPDLSLTNIATNATPPSAILTNNQPSLITSACSLAAKDECSVSTSDVVAILMQRGDNQEQK